MWFQRQTQANDETNKVQFSSYADDNICFHITDERLCNTEILKFSITLLSSDQLTMAQNTLPPPPLDYSPPLVTGGGGGPQY